jgi:hypothetical protein
MNYLLNTPETEITVDGKPYSINTDWKPAVEAWAAHCAYTAGELSEYGLAAAVCNLYNTPQPDIFNQTCIEFAMRYLNFYTDDCKGDGKIPPVDIEQDALMIKKGFLAMGKNLDSLNMTFSEFILSFGNMPENCEYAQIQGLRHKYYYERHKMKGKERSEFDKICARVGLGKIIVRSRASEKENNENEDMFLKWKNSERIKQGLPPVDKDGGFISQKGQ